MPSMRLAMPGPGKEIPGPRFPRTGMRITIPWAGISMRSQEVCKHDPRNAMPATRMGRREGSLTIDVNRTRGGGAPPVACF